MTDLHCTTKPVLYDQNTYPCGCETNGCRCRLNTRPHSWRIGEVAVTRLVEKFAGNTEPGDPQATRRGDTVSLELDGRQLVLDLDAAEKLRAALDDALAATAEFMHTTGEHRRDGKYVVERRGADSTGNRKVFESFGELERLADRLPKDVTADDLSRVGLTAGRRHMVLWHLVEHPEFPYELESRQPLTASRP